MEYVVCGPVHDRVNVHNLAQVAKLAQSGKNVFGAAIVIPLSN
jgi:hypothetical protein